MHKKFKIATLGCRTNQYESSAYQNQLLKAGYKEVQEGEQADLCIVNTCTVTQSADSHSRNQIRRLKKQHPNAKIVVTGCMVEKSKKQLLEIQEADLVVSNFEKENLLEKAYPEEEFPEFVIETLPTQTRAFVKVQDGCNSFCSYCIIPYVRGRSKSRSVQEIYQEVENLVQNGIKEVVLTGINIGDFDGADASQNTRLSHLVKAIHDIEGLKRIRISSIDPDEIDDELIETLKTCPKACRSMHIVLQSGSNWVLKRMNRKYNRQMFFQTVDRLKKFSSDFTFTTDIIVGFPGERECDFQDTLDVVKEVKFAKVHMFPYSPRERTKAALFEDSVLDSVKHTRKNELLQLSEQVCFELRNQYLGREMDILTEQKPSSIKTPATAGHTENFLKVVILGVELPANRLVKVRLIKNESEYLIGECI